MKNILKISLLFLLTAPFAASAYFSVPIVATSTSQGWAFPLKINGIEQALVSDHFFATSTSATSTFSGGIVGPNNIFFVQSNSGYVGIGTAIPTFPLTVVGGILSDTLNLTDNMAFSGDSDRSITVSPQPNVNTVGSALNAIGGQGNGTGNGGNFNGNGGDGGDTGTGGNSTLTGGLGGATSGNGGSIYLTGGTAQSGNGNGGSINLIGGLPNGTGSIGNILVTSGNMAIGTSSPKGILDVSGSSSGTDSTVFVGARAISLVNTNTTNNNMSGFDFRTMDANGLITTGSKIMGVYTSHTANAVSGDISFLTRNAGTISEKMRILANGNAGFGTTSPYAPLSVVGNGGIVAENIYATSTTATSTFDGATNIAQQTVQVYTSGQAAISNLMLGNLSFDTNAGQVSMGDLPVSSAASVNTIESYTDTIAGLPFITRYALSDGAGSIISKYTGIGTTTPSSKLTVWGDGTGAENAFLVSNNASTTEFSVNDLGQVVLAQTGSSASYSTGILQIANDTSGQLRPGIMSTGNGTSFATYGNGGQSDVASTFQLNAVLNKAAIGYASPTALNFVGGSNLNLATLATVGWASTTNAINDVGLRRFSTSTLEVTNGLSTGLGNLISSIIGVGGTTSPYSLLSVGNTLSTTANTPLITLASTTGGTSTTTLFQINANGDPTFGSPNPSASCAGTCTFDTNASDSSGIIYISGVQTSVTMTFKNAKAFAPHCVASDNVTTGNYDASSTPTQVVFSTAASLGTASISYWCPL